MFTLYRHGGAQIGTALTLVSCPFGYTIQMQNGVEACVGPVVVPPPPPPGNTPPVGNVDGADCSILSGWAYDPDTSSQSIDVHVYDGVAGDFSRGITATTANVPRGDVNAAFGITGNHGFSIATPSSLKTGTSHTLTFYAIDSTGGSNPPIGSKTVSCAAPIVCSPGVGAACTTAPNSCGMTNTGVVQNDCSCSVSTPFDSSCPFPASILLASPPKVLKGMSTTITWSAANVLSCSLRGPTGVIDSAVASSNTVASRSVSSGPVTGTTIYTLTCRDLVGGSISKSVTVGLKPASLEI